MKHQPISSPYIQLARVPNNHIKNQMYQPYIKTHQRTHNILNKNYSHMKSLYQRQMMNWYVTFSTASISTWRNVIQSQDKSGKPNLIWTCQLMTHWKTMKHTYFLQQLVRRREQKSNYIHSQMKNERNLTKPKKRKWQTGYKLELLKECLDISFHQSKSSGADGFMCGNLLNVQRNKKNLEKPRKQKHDSWYWDILTHN